MDVCQSLKPRPNWALLGGLRFLLALLVAGQHLTESVRDGTPYLLTRLNSFTAVEVFFIISGFSIRASFEREPNAFYRRRFWRVMPLYWLGLGLGYLPFAIWGPAIPYDFGLNWRWPGSRVFITQFLGLQPIIGDHFCPMNAALWSLGVEIGFYLLVPVIARVNEKVLATAVVLSAASTIIHWYGVFGPVFNPWPYLQSFWAFGAGWLFFAHREKVQAQVLLPVFVTVVCLARGEYGVSYGWLTMLTGSSIIAWSANLRLSNLSSALAEYLGDLSFPLYVLHWPLGWFVNLLNWNWPLVQVLPFVITVSILALHLCDRPCRSLGSRGKASKAVEPAEAMAA